MDDLDGALLSVRADTQGFARDVGEMRAVLEDALGAGADKAGRAIESALLRAVRTGKLGFEDLKRVALSVLSEIAAAAVRDGIGAILGRGGGTGLLGGLPGRATGGPVGPGNAYLVGERGPELFVPTASGRVIAGDGGGPRDVRVSITVNAGVGASAPEALARSSRQVARAVRAALSGAD